MKPCKGYRDAFNPTPKTLTRRAWVLSDQKGRIARYANHGPRLLERKPEGEMRGDGSIWKPRRVKITLEFPEAKCS